MCLNDINLLSRFKVLVKHVDIVLRTCVCLLEDIIDSAVYI